MSKRKGKGGLAECPSCKSGDVQVYDRDFVDHENMICRVRCNDCKKEFTEHWKAVDWEEVVIE